MKIFHLSNLLALVLSVGATFEQSTQAASDKESLGYIGSYTGARSKGIYAFYLSSSGEMSPPMLVAETVNPTFLAVHPNQKFLYAANETDKFAGKKSGG